MAARYYVRYRGRVQGPVTLEALRTAHRAGRIPADAEVGESPELFYPLAAMTYLLEERVPPPAPAAVPRAAAASPLRRPSPASAGAARSQGADAPERKMRGPPPRSAAHVASLVLTVVAAAVGLASLGSGEWIVLRSLAPLPAARSLSFHPVGLIPAGYMVPGFPAGALIEYDAMIPRIGGLLESDDRDVATSRGMLLDANPEAYYFHAGELEKTAFVGALGVVAGLVASLAGFLCSAVAVLSRIRVRREVLVLVATGPLASAALLGLFPFSGIIGVLAKSEHRELTVGAGYIAACVSAAMLLAATWLLAAGNAAHEAWSRRRGR